MKSIIKPIGHRSDFNQLRGLIDLICELPNNLVWCEIGCYDGDSTELWALRCSRLYCIDIWEWVPDYNTRSAAEVEAMFNVRMERFNNIIKLKGRSDNLNLLNKIPDGSLDGCYIDGFHSEEMCKLDIINMSRKLKDNAFITGHDYGNPLTRGVTKTVDNLLGGPDLYFQDWSWLKYFDRTKGCFQW